MQPTNSSSQPAAARLLRSLPAVDALTKAPAVVDAAGDLPRPMVVDTVRELLDEMRSRLLAGERGLANSSAIEQQLIDAAADRLSAVKRRFLTRVINATGVVLHTNLGRAPLSPAALQAVADVSSGYSNLEYTVDAGKRGSRHDYGEALLTRLTGAEAAMIVNNNAAAVLLVLSALAHGGEVVLSRGEMIEIGGAFRVPEVMEQSGCTLREVGTTNRTHLRDYENAVGEQTAAILKVHPSNYKISGFTASVSAQALVPLARRYGVPVIEDLGSGVLVETERYGLAREPTVQASVAAGADIVTFSGDKLLGGPQAGIIVGRKQFVEMCKAHPLARALRVDKMTLAALQATLASYLNDEEEQIPIYAMLGTSVVELKERAQSIVDRVQPSVAPPCELKVTNTISTVGGGSLPGEMLVSAGIAVRLRSATGDGRTHAPASTADWTADGLAAALRRALPPIVGRIELDDFILDLRTVDPADDALIGERLAHVLALPSQAGVTSGTGRQAGTTPGLGHQQDTCTEGATP